MSLKLNSSGGGSVTLQEPVTASDLTLNLPATLGNTGNSMAVTSDASGNVGVGVTPSAWGSDTRALQIFNRTSLSDLQSTTQLTNNGFWNGSGWIYRETAAVGNYNISGGTHVWRYAASGTAGNAITFTEAMRIDSSGNLLVGTTSSWSNGGVVINGTGNKGLIIGTSSVYRQQYMDTANGIMYWFNGSNQASLTSAGAWTNASDARLKKEITTIKYGLDTVLSTQPRSYKRVDVEGEYIGFVAQELKEQIPEVVFGSDTVQYSVDYGSLVAVAFKAIQELKAELDTVKAELAAMKGTA